MSSPDKIEYKGALYVKAATPTTPTEAYDHLLGKLQAFSQFITATLDTVAPSTGEASQLFSRFDERWGDVMVAMGMLKYEIENIGPRDEQ